MSLRIGLMLLLCVVAGCVPERGTGQVADASVQQDGASSDGQVVDLGDGDVESGDAEIAEPDAGPIASLRCGRSSAEPIGSGSGTYYYESVATYHGILSLGDTVTTPVSEGNVAHCWILHVTERTPLRVLSRIPVYSRDDASLTLHVLRSAGGSRWEYVDSDEVAPTFYEKHPTVDTGLRSIEPGYYEIGFDYRTSPSGISPPPNPDGTVTLVVTGDSVDSASEPTERGEIHPGDTLTTTLTEPQHHHRYFLDIAERSTVRFSIDASRVEGAGLYLATGDGTIDEYRWTPVVTSTSTEAVQRELDPGRYSVLVVGHSYSYWDGDPRADSVTISLVGEACVLSTWHRDWDGDGYASERDTYVACSPESATDSTTPPFDDCNDYSSRVHPGALEVCDDGLDNDCDGIYNPESLCPITEGILGSACRSHADCADGFTCSVFYRHYFDPVSGDVNVGGGGAELRCLQAGASGYPVRWSCHHAVGAPCYESADCCGALECVDGSCGEGPAPACNVTEPEWVGGPEGALSLPPGCRDTTGQDLCCPGQGCDDDAHNSEHVTTFRCVESELCGIGRDGFISSSSVNTCCTGYHYVPGPSSDSAECVPD